LLIQKYYVGKKINSFIKDGNSLIRMERDGMGGREGEEVGVRGERKEVFWCGLSIFGINGLQSLYEDG